MLYFIYCARPNDDAIALNGMNTVILYFSNATGRLCGYPALRDCVDWHVTLYQPYTSMKLVMTISHDCSLARSDIVCCCIVVLTSVFARVENKRHLSLALRY